MPLASPPKTTTKTWIKDALVASKGYFQLYLTPEYFLAFIVFVATLLAFLNIHSWFFIFASVFSLGYFGERAIKGYGRIKRTKQ